MIDVTPPELWLPSKPAIIRPSGDDIAAINAGGGFGFFGKPQAPPPPPAAVATYSGVDGLISNDATYNSAAMAIGTANATRRVVALLMTNRFTSTEGTMTGTPTIGGVTATVHESAFPASTLMRAMILSAVVPTGTTAVVSVAATTTRLWYCYVWYVNNLTTGVIDTALWAGNAGPVSLTSAADGVVLACAQVVSTNTTRLYTGCAEVQNASFTWLNSSTNKVAAAQGVTTGSTVSTQVSLGVAAPPASSNQATLGITLR